MTKRDARGKFSKKAPIERNVYEARRKLSIDEIERALIPHQMSSAEADTVLNRNVPGYARPKDELSAIIKNTEADDSALTLFLLGLSGVVVFFIVCGLFAFGIIFILELSQYLYDPIHAFFQHLPRF